jgi:hypothetical protein
MRTTLDLDSSVLEQLRRLQARERKSLGRLASELLAQALADRESAVTPDFAWVARPMGAQVDLEDADALERVLGGPR